MTEEPTNPEKNSLGETLFCTICKCETRKHGEPDDTGTQFYRCKKGHQTTKALNLEQLRMSEAFEIQAEQNGDKTYVDPLNPTASFRDGKGHFKTALVAQYFHYNYHFKADRQTEILYYFDGKSWKDNGEVYLQELLGQLLGEENRHATYTDVLYALKCLIYEDVIFSRKIAIVNGLLDLEQETVKIEPFSEKEMPFHYLPVTYDEKEPIPPSWEEFVKQVVNSDDIATLQEWSGYLLLPDYRFHKLLWVHGEGRNGKGAWQRSMEAILGEDNISGVGLEEFDGKHRFALRQLYGSLFNPCSEPITSEEKGLQTSLLKKATGQDTIDSEIKGKQKRLKFRNCAKITVLANRFPKILDTSTAFKERRLFIKFPNEFTGKNQIQNIEQNWLSENQKSGILNWMLQGLKRLLEQGYFTESKTQKETEIEFQKASDSIGAYLSEMGVFDKNFVTTRTDAYEGYKTYCETFGLYLCSERVFTQRLKETPKITITTVSKPSRLRAWKGIAFNKINDDGSVSPVSLVSPLYPSQTLDSKISNSIEGKNADTSDTSDTDKLQIVEEKSGVRHLEIKKRFCSNECANFDKPECTAPSGWANLNKIAEIPLKCPGYSYKVIPEEDF